MPPTEADAMAPPNIPGYESLRLIGEGGMGLVYLARQRKLERDVCIKVLASPKVHYIAELRERFEREAKILAMVSHPHILTILDFGVTPADASPYIVTEYIENGDLRKRLRSGHGLTPQKRRAILWQIGQALSHLHLKGILHRDLKPENILTPTDTLVKVADFGLAVLEREKGHLTRTHQGIGTLVYASPEQQAGGPVDERSDQYSLAAIAYEMWTGRRPVGTYQRPSELNPSLDRRVDDVLMKGLSVDPRSRYPDIESFSEALDEASSGGSSRIIRFASIASLSVLVLAISTYLLWPRPAAEKPAEAPRPVVEPEAAVGGEPPQGNSPEFHKLTMFRAREIWIGRGAPETKPGDGDSLQDWLKAEAEVKKQVRERAYEIWVSQGKPTGAEGDRLSEPNERRAEAELLEKAEAAHPDWK